MVAKFRKNKKDRPLKEIFFSILLGISLLLIIIILVFTNLRIKQRREKLISRIEALKQEIQILEEKNKKLKEGISESKSKDYLEKVAREQLGYKGPGEEVVVITREKKEEEEKEGEKKGEDWLNWLKSFWKR